MTIWYTVGMVGGGLFRSNVEGIMVLNTTSIDVECMLVGVEVVWTIYDII